MNTPLYRQQEQMVKYSNYKIKHGLISVYTRRQCRRTIKNSYVGFRLQHINRRAESTAKLLQFDAALEVAGTASIVVQTLDGRSLRIHDVNLSEIVT